MYKMTAIYTMYKGGSHATLIGRYSLGSLFVGKF